MNNFDELDDNGFERDLRALATAMQPSETFVALLESQLTATPQRSPLLWSRLIATLRGNEPIAMLDDDGFVVQQVLPARQPQPIVERRFAIGAFVVVSIAIVAGALLSSLASVRRVDSPLAAATTVPTMSTIIKPIWQHDLAVFGDVVALESFTQTTAIPGKPFTLTLNLRALNGPFDRYALTLKVSRNDTPLLASPVGALEQLAAGRTLSPGRQFSVTVPIDLWDAVISPTDVFTLALSVETTGTRPKRAALPVLYPTTSGELRHEAVLTTLSLVNSTSSATCSLANEDAATKAVRLIWPTSGSLTQQFWYGHKGIDIAAAVGVPVKAAGDGVVSFAGWNEVGYGDMVTIDHTIAAPLKLATPTTGTLRTNVQTLYAHLSAWYVDPGQTVKAGQVIGSIGSTGNATEPHLHFEVRVNDELCNPLPWLPWLPGDAPDDRLVWYTVQAGDTVSGIAARYGMTGIELTQLNPNLAPDRIQIGDRLAVQTKPAAK